MYAFALNHAGGAQNNLLGQSAVHVDLTDIF